MKRHRILFISPTARRGGGGEVVLTNIIQAFCQVGHNCAVAVPFDGPYIETWQRFGCRMFELHLRQFTGKSDVRSLNIFFHFQLLSAFFDVQKSLLRILKDFRPQIVYVNSFWAVYYVSFLSKLMRKRVIWHVHDLILPTAFNRVCVSIISQFVDRIIAISKAVAQRLINAGAIAAKISVVHNGINLDYFDARRFQDPIITKTELGISQTDFVALSAGRIIPRKGHDTLIKAFAILARKYPNVRLVILGDPYDFGSQQYKDYLVALVQALKIQDKILFVGWQPNVASFMSISDVIVSTSWAEPFGLSIIEAMAMGRPVIATNGGAEPEIVSDGISGFLVPPKDEKRLASALEQLARDNKLRKQMGVAALNRAKEYFSISRFISDIIAILEK